MTKPSLDGQVVWVTGASSGIGRSLALEASRRGAWVIVSGRRKRALSAVLDALPREGKVLAFDVTDHDVLPGTVAEALSWRGHVDVLINNAGISHRSLALDTDPRVYDRVLDVDLVSPILLTQALLPHLVAEQGRYVINISSVAGVVGFPKRTAYSAAKHGLVGYGDALRAETGTTYGLGVLNVYPGSVRTDVARNALDGSGRPGRFDDPEIEGGIDPDECGRRVLDALDQGLPEVVIANDEEEQLVNDRRADPSRAFATTAGIGSEMEIEASALRR